MPPPEDEHPDPTPRSSPGAIADVRARTPLLHRRPVQRSGSTRRVARRLRRPRRGGDGSAGLGSHAAVRPGGRPREPTVRDARPPGLDRRVGTDPPRRRRGRFEASQAGHPRRSRRRAARMRREPDRPRRSDLRDGATRRACRCRLRHPGVHRARRDELSGSGPGNRDRRRLWRVRGGWRRRVDPAAGGAGRAMARDARRDRCLRRRAPACLDPHPGVASAIAGGASARGRGRRLGVRDHHLHGRG